MRPRFASTSQPASFCHKTTAGKPRWVLALLLAAVGQVHGHGELEIRIAELSRQLLTNSTNPQLFLERAGLHRLHQDWPAAAADLDRATALDTNLATVKLERARFLADA